MKYIMLQVLVPRSDATIKIPIIFPKLLVHSEVAERMIHLLRRQFREVKAVSAGEVFFQVDGGCLTTGGSETLNLKAEKTDARIIETHDYLHGLE